MSLLRREQVCVALSPWAVTCVRRSGLGRRAGSPEPLSLGAQAAEGPDWRPAIDTLRDWVAARATGRGDMRVVLSNHFVRVLVVPWSDELTAPGERLALARHLFRATYGERADGWQVQLSPSGHGHAALACAVDQALHDTLASMLAGTPWRLVALQPLFTVVFNDYRRVMGDDAALFVLEPGRSCCLVFRAGRWVAARATRCLAASPAAGVDRERQLLGLPDELPAFVYSAAAGPDAGPAEAAGAPADQAQCRRLGAPGTRRPDAALALFAGGP